MSDQDTATEEEKFLAPLHLDLEVTLNGVKMASRCFIRQSDWEGMETDEERKDQIRAGLQGMADAVLDLIDRRGLMHPEQSATV